MKNFFRKLFHDEKEEEEQRNREICKIEEEKTMGPLYFLYQNGPYKKIGLRPEDVLGDNKHNSEEILYKFKNLDLLKNELWNGIGPKIRPMAWRMLFKYAPYKKSLQESIITKKRNQYREII